MWSLDRYRGGEGNENRRIQKIEEGRVGGVLLWLLGIPIPVLLILFLLRGCT